MTLPTLAPPGTIEFNVCVLPCYTWHHHIQSVGDLGRCDWGLDDVGEKLAQMWPVTDVLENFGITTRDGCEEPMSWFESMLVFEAGRQYKLLAGIGRDQLEQTTALSAHKQAELMAHVEWSLGGSIGYSVPDIQDTNTIREFLVDYSACDIPKVGSGLDL